jgi:succinyl-CoA synthetase beta subunit
MVASKRGGMDIEEVRTAALPARKRALVSHARMYRVSQVAAESPGDIYSEAIDILKGLGAEQAKKMALRLGFEGAQADDAADQMVKLYRLFIERDATQVEINPFVVATNGKVYCVDAKINFDDNAAFRQQALFAMRDKSMEDPREVAASEHSLNYIGLDGNIGCMVNGAGLAMTLSNCTAACLPTSSTWAAAPTSSRWRRRSRSSPRTHASRPFWSTSLAAS